MFISDVPNIPAQEPPLMVADASATQNSAQKYDRVIGICHLSANPFIPKSADNVLSPSMEVESYYNITRSRVKPVSACCKCPHMGYWRGQLMDIFLTILRKAISATIMLPCWSKWAAKKSGWNISSA